MPSLEANALAALNLHGRLVKSIGEVHYHHGRQVVFASVKRDLLEELRITSILQGTESSNGIEGIVLDRERYHAIMTNHEPPTTRSEQEVAGYRDALDFIHTHFAQLEVTPETIKDLHRRIYSYSPEQGGEYRKENVSIVRRGGAEEPSIAFTPSPWELVERQMVDLCRNYRRLFNDAETDAFLLLAAFVFDFTCIHPFTNGNGRVSRLLTTLLAYKAGFEFVRYIALERIVFNTKSLYYYSLSESSLHWHRSQHRLEPWLSYLADTFNEGYRELDERLSKTEMRGHKSERVREAIQQAPSIFTIRDLIMACPSVMRPTIVKVLQEEKEVGHIIPLGKGPMAKYRKASVID